MGEYMYRLKGTKSFTVEKINGWSEKVYDLVFWYKPLHSTFWDDKQPKWMKPMAMLEARLHSAFEKNGYPKYVQLSHVEDDGTLKRYREGALEWRNGLVCISDSSKLFDELKRVKFGDTTEPVAN